MGRYPLFPAYAALAAVCFFWGTTYLGIRMALEMFPPPMLLSFRFLLSGGILLVACKWMNLQFPPLRTVVAFWSAERRHYHFSVFKPLEEVRESDMPPAAPPGRP